MSVGAVLVDPFDDQALRDLAELAGIPVRRCATWPFDLTPGERVISTIPVPSVHAGRALGVVVREVLEPGLGEAWPARTVVLEDAASDVVAHLSGSFDPRGSLVAVVGTRGGIGTTSVAAALARVLAEDPIAVALVDIDPVPRLRSLLGLAGGTTWGDLTGDAGPLLPHRLDASLPVWERVRVLTSDSRGGPRGRHGAALHALACTHDTVVVDLGNRIEEVDAIGPAVCVVVLAAELPDVTGVSAVLGPPSEGRAVVPVVRPGSLSTEEVAFRLGIPVVPLGTERGGPAASAHGSRPGDRPRGAVMKAARAVAKACREHA
ncbi:MAG: cellulose synthase operon protein YhjQ/BcsQ [bacterium]|nr:cellulose synthase operon protein YhjQ/BcsQ [bacterium]